MSGNPFLRSIIVLALVARAGCGVNGSPGLWERGWIESREKAMVLVRLTAQGEDQRVIPGVKVLQLATVDFETGGQEQPIEYTMARGLDAASARDGWYFMLLDPGTHYLVIGAARPPGQNPPDNHLQPDENGRVKVLRVRIDVPAGVGAVYAGSLHVPVSTRRLIFGRECTGIDDAGVTITDESPAAAALVAERVAWAGATQTSLMTRHQQPTLQFRTASANP